MKEEYLEFEQDGVKYNLYDLPDGFVIKGDLDLSGCDLQKLPDLSKITVEGSFDCSYNELTSLKGAPREVGWMFNCSNNHLTSLEGAPQKVGGFCNCNDNQLETLKGAPREVGSWFSCANNNLTTLYGAPEKVALYFMCCENRLRSLFSVSAMPEFCKIYCDEEVGEKYGFHDTTFKSNVYEGGIDYKKLLESPLYKSEVSKHNIALKKQQSRADGQKKMLSWYKDFKKNNTQNPTGRE